MKNSDIHNGRGKPYHNWLPSKVYTILGCLYIWILHNMCIFTKILFRRRFYINFQKIIAFELIEPVV